MTSFTTPGGISLPPELLHQVLCHLQHTRQQSTLAKLQSCSKSFYAKVTPHLYQHVTLDGQGADKLVGRMLEQDQKEFHHFFRVLEQDQQLATAITFDDPSPIRLRKSLNLIRQLTYTQSEKPLERYAVEEILPIVRLLRNMTDQLLCSNLASISLQNIKLGRHHQKDTENIMELLTKVSEPSSFCVRWNWDASDQSVSPAIIHHDYEREDPYDWLDRISNNAPTLSNLVLHQIDGHMPLHHNLPNGLRLSYRPFALELCLGETERHKCIADYRDAQVQSLVRASYDYVYDDCKPWLIVCGRETDGYQNEQQVRAMVEDIKRCEFETSPFYVEEADEEECKEGYNRWRDGLKVVKADDAAPCEACGSRCCKFPAQRLKCTLPSYRAENGYSGLT